jgi:hypothetical protein
MHADNRGVDHPDSGIMGRRECVYDTTPHAGPPPANEEEQMRLQGASDVFITLPILA